MSRGTSASIQRVAAITVLVGACGAEPGEGAAGVGGLDPDDAATTDATAEPDPRPAGESGADDSGWDDAEDEGADEVFDVGARDEGGDDGEDQDDDGSREEGGDEGGTREEWTCGVRECVDTTADAALLLEPCNENFADFYPPYDEFYECWSGSPGGHFIGDTDTTFAYDDPDLLLVSQWDGGIGQARVTRDAHCNITGFVDAQWQPYPEPEPEDVKVRGMTWLDDGTMFVVRWVPGQLQQIGQRPAGAAVTSQLVDTLSVLPPWEDLFYGNNNVIVSLSVVPHGFPGAGDLKVLAEKLDTTHWLTLPAVAVGDGTYELGAAVEETTIFPPEDDWGGYYARGVAWIGDDNPEIAVPSVLVPEAWHYTVSLYELDAEGNPLPDTRTPFVDGLGMPSGAESDAVSGNNFVFTGRRSQDVYVIRGCDDGASSPTDPRG